MIRNQSAATGGIFALSLSDCPSFFPCLSFYPSISGWFSMLSVLPRSHWETALSRSLSVLIRLLSAQQISFSNSFEPDSFPCCVWLRSSAEEPRAAVWLSLSHSFSSLQELCASKCKAFDGAVISVTWTVLSSVESLDAFDVWCPSLMLLKPTFGKVHHQKWILEMGLDRKSVWVFFLCVYVSTLWELEVLARKNQWQSSNFCITWGLQWNKPKSHY